MMDQKNWKTACLSAVAIAALAGCASQGDLKASVTPLDAARYGVADAKAQPLAEAEAWWGRLGDPALAR